jgi:hypothetical protein
MKNASAVRTSGNGGEIILRIAAITTAAAPRDTKSIASVGCRWRQGFFQCDDGNTVNHELAVGDQQHYERQKMTKWLNRMLNNTLL